MNFDYNIIEEKMKNLPEEIQQALTSTEITNAIKEISKDHDLKLDQEEVLYNQTAYVLLGLIPSKEFVKNFSKETGVDETIAKAVAGDVNDKVFGKIRSSMRTLEEKTASETSQQTIGTSNGNFGSPNFSNASLEQAGGFKIEPSLAGTAAKADNSGVNATDRAGILDSIENPTAAKEQSVTKEEAAHYEPLVDQLLNGPAAIPQEKIVRKIEDPGAQSETQGQATIPSSAIPKPAKPQPPVNLPTSDPYREPIK